MWIFPYNAKDYLLLLFYHGFYISNILKCLSWIIEFLSLNCLLY